MKGTKDKKQIKKKIGEGYVVKAKVGEMEDKKSEGRIRMTRKEVLVCAQAVVGKNNLPFKFKDGKKIEISSSLLSYLCPKEEVGQ